MAVLRGNEARTASGEHQEREVVRDMPATGSAPSWSQLEPIRSTLDRIDLGSGRFRSGLTTTASLGVLAPLRHARSGISGPVQRLPVIGAVNRDPALAGNRPTVPFLRPVTNGLRHSELRGRLEDWEGQGTPAVATDSSDGGQVQDALQASTVERFETEAVVDQPPLEQSVPAETITHARPASGQRSPDLPLVGDPSRQPAQFGFRQPAARSLRSAVRARSVARSAVPPDPLGAGGIRRPMESDHSDSAQQRSVERSPSSHQGDAQSAGGGDVEPGAELGPPPAASDLSPQNPPSKAGSTGRIQSVGPAPSEQGAPSGLVRRTLRRAYRGLRVDRQDGSTDSARTGIPGEVSPSVPVRHTPVMTPGQTESDSPQHQGPADDAAPILKDNGRSQTPLEELNSRSPGESFTDSPHGPASLSEIPERPSSTDSFRLRVDPTETSRSDVDAVGSPSAESVGPEVHARPVASPLDRRSSESGHPDASGPRTDALTTDRRHEPLDRRVAQSFDRPAGLSGADRGTVWRSIESAVAQDGEDQTVDRATAKEAETAHRQDGQPIHDLPKVEVETSYPDDFADAGSIGVPGAVGIQPPLTDTAVPLQRSVEQTEAPRLRRLETADISLLDENPGASRPVRPGIQLPLKPLEGRIESRSSAGRRAKPQVEHPAGDSAALTAEIQRSAGEPTDHSAIDGDIGGQDAGLQSANSSSTSDPSLPGKGEVDRREELVDEVYRRVSRRLRMDMHLEHERKAAVGGNW